MFLKIHVREIEHRHFFLKIVHRNGGFFESTPSENPNGHSGNVGFSSYGIFLLFVQTTFWVVGASLQQSDLLIVPKGAALVNDSNVCNRYELEYEVKLPNFGEA